MNNLNNNYAAKRTFDSPQQGLRPAGRNLSGVILLPVLVFAFVSCLSFLIPFEFLGSQFVQGNGSRNAAEKAHNADAKALSLEDRIRAAENRELRVPDSLLVDPYDGTCLGKNRIQHFQSEELNDPPGALGEATCSSGNENSSAD